MQIDYVISTIPLKEMISLIRPKIPDNIRHAAEKLKYRSLLLYYLIIRRERVLNDNWIFFPEKKYIFNRISEQKSFSMLTAPVDKTSLIVEIAYDQNNLDYNRNIYERIVSDLEDAKIIKKQMIEDSFFKTIKDIYPVYDLDFRKNLDMILNYIDGIENLYTIGRHGLFNYNNIDHCIDMSLNTAKHIISGKTKKNWKILLERFNNYRIVD